MWDKKLFSLNFSLPFWNADNIIGEIIFFKSDLWRNKLLPECSLSQILQMRAGFPPLPVGQGGAHKDPAHELHGAEDVGQAEEDVVDLLVQAELAQLSQDVVKGDLLHPGGVGLIISRTLRQQSIRGSAG